MDLVLLAQDALKFFQQIQPGVEAAAAVGSALGTMGTAVVQVVQKGAQIVTYLIEGATPKSPEFSPETLRTTPPVKDVAVLVDINRRMLVDVARFLDGKKIDAEIFIVTNDPRYSENIKFLDPANPAEWEAVITEYKTAVNSIKRASGAARMHIFLSTTVAQAFAFGAVWGTVDEATVYHWEKGTYFPNVKITRALR